MTDAAVDRRGMLEVMCSPEVGERYSVMEEVRVDVV
jgi:hypothetical protein